MKNIISLMIVIVLVLALVLCITIFEKQEEAIIPEETAIELANAITILRPSFMNLSDVVKICKGTGFTGYESAFLKAEEASGIGADYLIAIAFHETGRGTNYWWKYWNNAFSWGITDARPNSEAYKVKQMSKEEAIIYCAKKIKELYLTKGGAYYSGETLSAIGKYYASDKNWANSILTIHSDIVKNLTEEQKAKQWIMETKILQGNMPGPTYFTNDYWDSLLTRKDIAIILWRIHNK